jgi:hypothetical protein
MSLLGFQLALADLSSSVELCARVQADPGTALAEYELTPVERRRLESVARQKGTRVNVALYRHNRLVTLVTVLPGTIHLLGGQARAVVDEFWPTRGWDRNMRREAQHFAAFVRRMLDDGRLGSPCLREVLDFEMARYEVATAPHAALLAQVAQAAERWPGGPLVPHPLVRVAVFGHDPEVLLTHVAYKGPPPYADALEGEFHLLLDARSGRFEQRPLDPRAAELLLDPAIRNDPARSAEVEELVTSGLLVRADPAVAGALNAWELVVEGAA